MQLFYFFLNLAYMYQSFSGDNNQIKNFEKDTKVERLAKILSMK